MGWYEQLIRDSLLKKKRKFSFLDLNYQMKLL